MTLKAATLDYRVARYLWYFQPACTSLAVSQGFEERASQFLGPLGCSGKTQKIMCKTQNSYVCVSTQDPSQTNSSSGLGLDRRAKSCNDRPWKPIVNCDVFCLEHARSRSVHFLDCARSLWQAHKARVDGFSTRSLEGGAYWSLLDAIPLIQTQSRDRDCVSASKLWRPVDQEPPENAPARKSAIIKQKRDKSTELLFRRQPIAGAPQFSTSHIIIEKLPKFEALTEFNSFPA